MPLENHIMKSVEAYADQFLSEGRKGWDMPHTRAVVHYARELAISEGQDILVLETAAWFHDIGYFGLFNENDSEQNTSMKVRKLLHMERGAQFTKDFLNKPKISTAYTSKQRERIIHLVGVHDKVTELRDLDELILMEADTLGQIDIARVTPTFDYNNAMKYIKNGLEAKRIPRFTTELGKNYLEQLLPEFLLYFTKQQIG